MIMIQHVLEFYKVRDLGVCIYQYLLSKDPGQSIHFILNV